MKVVEGAKVTPDASGSSSKTFFIPEAEVPGTSYEDDDFAAKAAQEDHELAQPITAAGALRRHLNGLADRSEST